MTLARCCLRLVVGNELGISFQALDPELAARLGRYLAFLVAGPETDGTIELVVTEGEPPPSGGEPSAVVIHAPPVQVLRMGDVVLFVVPGAVAWCDPGQGRGGIVVRHRGPAVFDALTGLVAAPLLMELAAPHGWLGLHAAGVAWKGEGLLMPASSGHGKSTIVRHAAAFGLDVLSDDLVWVHEAEDGFRMWAFPRGVPAEPAPAPTIDTAPIAAIVAPSIVDHSGNSLKPLDPEQVLSILVPQSGFLSGGRHAALRFETLVKLANTPAWRLEAGADRAGIPPLLQEIVTPAPQGVPVT